MTNINDLLTAANNAEDTAPQGNNDLLGPAELKNGDVVTCKITYADARESSKGGPQWVNKLTVVDGPLKDQEFFDTITLSVKSSAGSASYNKRQFAKLRAAGVTDELVASGASSGAIAAAIKDSLVDVTIKWQKVKEGDDPNRPWSEHTWAAAGGAPAGGFTPSKF